MSDTPILSLKELYIAELMKASGVPTDLVTQAFNLAQRLSEMRELLQAWLDEPEAREAIVGDLRHLIDTASVLLSPVPYGVFGWPGGSDPEFLGIYSTPESAASMQRT